MTKDDKYRLMALIGRMQAAIMADELSDVKFFAKNFTDVVDDIDSSQGETRNGAFLTAEEIELLNRKPPKIILCIKMVRDRTGFSLKESKRYVDQFRGV